MITRSGRVESDAGWGETKRPTRMIAEGSVLVASAEPRGVSIDVAPEGFPHPVYRAGYALAIPIPQRPAVRELPKEAEPEPVPEPAPEPADEADPEEEAA